MQQHDRTKFPPVESESDQEIREEQEALAIEEREFREVTEMFDKRNRHRFESFEHGSDRWGITVDHRGGVEIEKMADAISEITAEIYDDDAPEDEPVRFHLASPPGYRMLGLAELFVSPQTYELNCEPLIADWNKEYLEALKQERHWVKFAALRIRYTCSLIRAVIWWKAFETLGKLAEKVVGK